MTAQEGERRERMQYFEKLAILPEHMRESVQRWIEEGEPHPTAMGLMACRTRVAMVR